MEFFWLSCFCRIQAAQPPRRIAWDQAKPPCRISDAGQPGCLALRFFGGIPRLLRGQIPMTGDPTDTAVDVPLEVGGAVRYGTAVSMGNPHFVMFGPDVEHALVRELGPQIENHPAFPAKTNVEFVSVVDPQTLRMRVWERGAGITRACGTGACASVVAAVINGKTGRKVTVKLDGGDLYIDWPEQKNIFMTGPAEEIFDGEWKNAL